MEESYSVNDNRGKRQRKCTDDSVCTESHPTGVVVWDIDDTIVIIQASLKLHRDIYQLELVKSVKNYLTAYLDKEFYFNSTLHMEVVERLVDWEKEPLPPTESPTQIESGEQKTTDFVLGNDVIATGKSYSAFLKSHYRAFQKQKDESSEVSTPADVSRVDDDDNDLKSACATSTYRYDRLPPGWRETYEAMESKTFLWTQQARSVLAHLKKNNVRNMIVTASELAPAVAKLIMWDLFEFFDIDDIYSSAKKAKTTVFEHLLQDLGRSPHIPQYVGKYQLHHS
jgi:phosphoglycolate phosphatase-like HAD superfamily hydrolase